jgi:hypothetical protein
MHGETRNSHSNFDRQELHTLYSSPSIIRMIKSRRMRTGENRNAYGLLVGKPHRKRPILRWILERQDAVEWARLICLRIGTSRGLL